MTELLTPKELAAALKRHVNYVYWMRRRGFRMVAYRTTLTAALEWLKANPKPCSGRNKKKVARCGI